MHHLAEIIADALTQPFKRTTCSLLAALVPVRGAERNVPHDRVSVGLAPLDATVVGSHGIEPLCLKR